MMKNIDVSATGEADYPTIQEAINAARPEDTILIAPGTYNEAISIDKPISIRGKGQGVSLTSSSQITVLIKDCAANIEGLEITSTGSSPFPAINIRDATLKLIDSSVHASGGIGCKAERSTLTLHGVRITDCAIGIELNEVSIAEVARARLVGNGTGIRCESESDLTCEDVTFSDQANHAIQLIHAIGRLYQVIVEGVKRTAVVMEHSTIHIQNSCFDQNGFDEELWWNVYAFMSQVNVKEVAFTNGAAGIGLAGDSDLHMEDSSFSDHEGRSLGVFDTSNAHLLHCDLIRTNDLHIAVIDQATCTMTESRVEQATYTGIFVTGEASATLIKTAFRFNGQATTDEIFYSQVKVEGHTCDLHQCTIEYGYHSGITVEAGGRVTLQSTRIAHHPSFSLKGVEAVLHIDDSTFDHSHDAHILAEASSSLMLTSSSLLHATSNAIFLHGASHATIRDVTCLWNGSQKDETSGYPQCLIVDSEVTLQRSLIAEGAFQGLVVSGDSHVSLQDVQIDKHADENLVIEAEALVEKRGPEAEGVYAPKQTESIDLSAVSEELNELIGLQQVKQEIQEQLQFNAFREKLVEKQLPTLDEDASHAFHIIMKGNPGTGKTTLARLYGKLYASMGLLEKGQVVEVNRDKLLGRYIAQTTDQTKKYVEEASGGILFIDEAYDLYREDNDRDFGNDAITYIMQEMENRKGEFIVIAAGYEQEMDAFLKANPGLNSRFDHHITLPDYDPDELLLIGEAMLTKKGRSLTKEASEYFYGELTDRWRKRDRHFGNARTVRNLVQIILKAQGQRMMSQPDHEWTTEAITTIVKEDIQQACRSERHTIFEVPVQEKELQQALTELHKLIGLTELKQEIEQVVTLTRYFKEERKNVAMLHPHIVLKGSPGTGKTIVARLLARIYQALGILEGGHIIEVNRDKLVSSYQGETEKRTKEAIEAAHGGMLFIDEAYQLTQYGIDDIGHKAIETLLTYMEEARGSMIVIVAGYREEMDQFLQANAGLPRRFNQTFDFPDYSPDELLRIAKLIAKEHGYTIAKEAEESLYTIFHKHYSVRDRTFGNAGFVRNIMSQAFKKHDLAMASKTQTERQMLDQQVIHVQHLP